MSHKHLPPEFLNSWIFLSYPLLRTREFEKGWMLPPSSKTNAYIVPFGVNLLQPEISSIEMLISSVLKDTIMLETHHQEAFFLEDITNSGEYLNSHMLSSKPQNAQGRLRILKCKYKSFCFW